MKEELYSAYPPPPHPVPWWPYRPTCSRRLHRTANLGDHTGRPAVADYTVLPTLVTLQADLQSQTTPYCQPWWPYRPTCSRRLHRTANLGDPTGRPAVADYTVLPTLVTVQADLQSQTTPYCQPWWPYRPTCSRRLHRTANLGDHTGRPAVADYTVLPTLVTIQADLQSQTTPYCQPWWPYRPTCSRRLHRTANLGDHTGRPAVADYFCCDIFHIQHATRQKWKTLPCLRKHCFMTVRRSGIDMVMDGNGQRKSLNNMHRF